jgi:hypothetical protein
VDEDGSCAPAAKIFRRYALSRGIEFEVAFLVGVGGPNKRIDVIDGAYQLASDQNMRQRIKRKLQAKRGGIMTGAGTVIIAGAAKATSSDVGVSSAVTAHVRADGEISPSAICISPTLYTLTIGVRGTEPPPTG